MIKNSNYPLLLNRAIGMDPVIRRGDNRGKRITPSYDVVHYSVLIDNCLASKADKLIFDLGFEGKKILLVSDQKIWQNSQKFFAADFLEIFSEVLFLKNPKADEKNLEKILKTAKDFDLILTLGSGVINDLCKLTSAKTKIPYAVFASAASMNGYLSRNASIAIKGHKKTLPATLPIAVFCDLGIIKSAPQNMIKAGLGDAMCFYSCWFDWYLSHLILQTKFDERPFKILEKKMEFLVKNYQKFSLGDEKFIKILIEILLLSGAGMTMAGGSYPASQSEHLIAHAIEMKFTKKMHDILHGNQIVVTTLTAAKLQHKLLKRDILQLKKAEFDEAGMVKYFGKKIAQECKKEFSQKIFTQNKISEINISLQKNWKSYQKKLAKIHFSEIKLKAIFSHFKIATSEKSLKLSNEEYQAAVGYAKFIRNRFTCLDL